MAHLPSREMGLNCLSSMRKSFQAHKFAAHFFCCFLISSGCLFGCLKKPKVFPISSEMNLSGKPALHGTNSLREVKFSVFLPTLVPIALSNVAEAQIFNSVIPNISAGVIHPRSIRNLSPEHRPDNAVHQILRPVDAQLLVHLLAVFVDNAASSFGVGSSRFPRLEMPWAGEIFQLARFPCQNSSFGIVIQQTMKFICGGNALAIFPASEYIRLSIGDHVVVGVIADVEHGRVSFPSHARQISHIHA